MTTLSVLDLAPIVEGSDAATSFRNSLSLARHVEALGFKRFWLAEHHGMPGIASAATSVLIGHIAGGTSSMRIGAGGIMLPNHSPLIIAEQFGTLESLYPGRIDLGLGRAPGSDQIVARALRRHLDSNPDAFPQDVLELMEYFSLDSRLPVTAVPGKGLSPEFWILGSSLFGAQLAAYLGLPYSFASHFAPQMLMQAIETYRNNFRPSAHLAEPYVMLGYNVFAADSDDDAHFLASSWQQSFVSLRTGQPIRLPPPVAGYTDTLSPSARAMLDTVLSCTAVGDAGTVSHAMRQFIARTQADELIITTNMHDHQARLRSYEIVASIKNSLQPTTGAQDAQPAS
ncbi:MAG: LLM class flavin-dependent oxidoreductase [Alcaligenaceae bacterium]|nr:LLM class flavin-dependent oxidoreductase [Alcaligenaceae bacterium]